MEFEWDEAKDVENRRKHGLALGDAVLLDWVGAKIVIDARYDYGETRSLAYGRIAGRLHTCAYTLRGNAARIISLRKSNIREIRDHGTPSETTPD
jgi:uncharacterized protein